jgi:hypothetical protein
MYDPSPTATSSNKRKRSSPSSAKHPNIPDLQNKLTRTITILTRGASPKAPVRSFALHVNVLAEKSPYLRELIFAEISVEASAADQVAGELKLLELDGDAFAVFAEWMYSGKISFSKDDGADEEDAGDILPRVLECYLLAQKLECRDFGNAIHAHACYVSAMHGLVFRNSAINDIYRRTTSMPGCALKRWIIDEWCWQYDADAADDLTFADNYELVNGFLFDVIKEQAARIGGGSEAAQKGAKKVRRSVPNVADAVADCDPPATSVPECQG